METDQSRDLLWKQLVNRARKQAVLLSSSMVAALICLVYASVREIGHQDSIRTMTSETLRRMTELRRYDEQVDQCTTQLTKASTDLRRCISGLK